LLQTQYLIPPSRKIEYALLGLRNLYLLKPFVETMIYKMLVSIFLIVFAQMMFIIIATLIFIHFNLKMRETETYLEKAIQDAKLEILTNCAFEDGNPFTLY
jgi:hypothetical protein